MWGPRVVEIFERPLAVVDLQMTSEDLRGVEDLHFARLTISNHSTARKDPRLEQTPRI